MVSFPRATQKIDNDQNTNIEYCSLAKYKLLNIKMKAMEWNNCNLHSGPIESLVQQHPLYEATGFALRASHQ